MLPSNIFYVHLCLPWLGEDPPWCWSHISPEDEASESCGLCELLTEADDALKMRGVWSPTAKDYKVLFWSPEDLYPLRQQISESMSSLSLIPASSWYCFSLITFNHRSNISRYSLLRDGWSLTRKFDVASIQLRMNRRCVVREASWERWWRHKCSTRNAVVRSHL